MILAARHFRGTEYFQVIGDELGVEQPKPSGPEAGDQVDERHFGGVAGASAGIAKILFFIFLVLLVISLIAHVSRGRVP